MSDTAECLCKCAQAQNCVPPTHQQEGGKSIARVLQFVRLGLAAACGSGAPKRRMVKDMGRRCVAHKSLRSQPSKPPSRCNDMSVHNVHVLPAGICSQAHPWRAGRPGGRMRAAAGQRSGTGRTAWLPGRSTSCSCLPPPPCPTSVGRVGGREGRGRGAISTQTVVRLQCCR